MRLFAFLTAAILLTACGPAAGDNGAVASNDSCTRSGSHCDPLVTSPLPPPVSPKPPPATGCLQPSDPASHTYHPARLTVLNACVTVTGRIAVERPEADGDYHILLAVDAGQLDPNGGNWINSQNTAIQHGDLIVEPNCELSVSQSDAVSTCAGYHNPVVVPPIGTHVRVRGAWVLDTQHGWQEIHPVMEISVIP